MDLESSIINLILQNFEIRYVLHPCFYMENWLEGHIMVFFVSLDMSLTRIPACHQHYVSGV